MAYYKVRGLSIAVISNFKIDWAKGYGWADSAENRRIAPNTIFQAGSVSKTLNAVGIFKLAQMNKIGLEKDINTYLKTWTFPYDSLSAGKKISNIQLIQHTAGLSVYGFDGYTSKDTIPILTDILDGKKPANSKPANSVLAPCSKFKYSGGGSTISQLVIEDISGISYQK